MGFGPLDKCGRSSYKKKEINKHSKNLETIIEELGRKR